MVPGTTHISTQTLLPETKYLGVVAFFRRPDAHYWRYLIDAEQVRTKGLSFQALDCYLRLKDMKAATIPGQPIDAKPACFVENIAVPATPTSTPSEQAANEKPRKQYRTKKATNSKASATTVSSAPTVRASRPVTPLPTPPEPTVAKPAVALPTVNVNVSPNLSLPKWGVQ